ncbi:hypothetical protein D3C81_1261100 [compost metagenome]
MQLAATAAQLAARLHAGDHQHRDRIGIGLAHGGGDVGHPRAGDDEAHARFATCPCIAISHETGTLLMARGDMTNGGRCQAAIELNGMHAWNAEDMVHTIAFKEFDQYFAAGCHVYLP